MNATEVKENILTNWQAYAIVVLMSGATGTGAGLLQNEVAAETREYVHSVLEEHEEEPHSGAATKRDVSNLCKNQQIIVQGLVAAGTLKQVHLTCGGE